MADAKYVLVPAVSARDVQLLASRKTIVCCETLAETVKAIKTSKALPKIETQDIAPSNGFCDLAEVSGQNEAKEALEISAVGGLNLLLMGPPGMGKTMLARCMPGIVPPLEENEQIEITGIWSLRGLIERNQYVKYRPFREVHHTISREGLVGGGTRGQIRPGEISLAHKGFLLLDEILEFPRNVIESIRQPLEDGFISIGRSGETVKLPCQFTLLGTANPCPCGWSGTYICNSCGMTKLRMCCSEKTVHKCKCQQKQIAKYLMKLSGPIIDRIDMKVIVEPFNEKLIERQSNGTAQVRERIMKARERAKELTGCEIGKCNVMKIVKLDAESRRKIGAVMQSISARGATKIMKIAMSICCLKGENMVKWWMVEQAQKLFLGK
jgi:magnesium chelatase family protein